MNVSCPHCNILIYKEQYAFIGTPGWRYKCQDHFHFYTDVEENILCFTVSLVISKESFILFTWQAGAVPNVRKICIVKEIDTDTELETASTYIPPDQALQRINKYKKLLAFL